MNIDETIMSQYANSSRLLSIIRSVSGALDPSKFTEDFYRLVMNIPTANSYGLDIWGRIVGISRTVKFPSPQGEYLGFAEGFYPFNERPFSGSGSESDTWELATDAYRELILMKALANIIYATAPNINRLLESLFEDSCYFLITGHMEARYVFEFNLSPYQRHIVYNTDILPRPCGVLISIIINAETDALFGFEGSGLQPLGQGVFFDGTT